MHGENGNIAETILDKMERRLEPEYAKKIVWKQKRNKREATVHQSKTGNVLRHAKVSNEN